MFEFIKFFFPKKFVLYDKNPSQRKMLGLCRTDSDRWQRRIAIGPTLVRCLVLAWTIENFLNLNIGYEKWTRDDGPFCFNVDWISGK